MALDELPSVPDLTTWSFEATPQCERKRTMPHRLDPLSSEGETLLHFCKRQTLRAVQMIGEQKTREDWWPRLISQMLTHPVLIPTNVDDWDDLDSDEREKMTDARRMVSGPPR